MTVQEAVTSSKIEGTRATASDVLMYEAGGGSSMDPSKRDDVREVVNYRIAVRTAQRMLADMPLTGRVLKAAHAELLSGVRGAAEVARRAWDRPELDRDDERPQGREVHPDLCREAARGHGRLGTVRQHE